MVTTKPKTRKAPASDPIFAAIAEHKALARKLNRIRGYCRTARAEAEEKYGDPVLVQEPPKWAGWADINPFYRQWYSTRRVELKAAMRMARTTPETLAGVAALVDYTRRDYSRDEENEDWIAIALKTIAASLDRMIGEQRQAVAESVAA
jgi:hypothetical protein